MMPIYDANNQFDRNFFKLYGEMQAEAAALSGSTIPVETALVSPRRSDPVFHVLRIGR